MTEEKRALRTRRRPKPDREERGKVTTRSAAYGDEQEENRLLDRRYFPPGVEPAFVRISAGGTYNLGNYESLRLDVSITMPCMAEEINDTAAEVSFMVQERLGEEEANWLGRTVNASKKKAKVRS